MPVGRVKLSGNLGAQAPYGKALSSTGAALALRGAAKMGVGNQLTGQPNPVKPGQSNEIFGIPMGPPSKKKVASKGRQNQPVKVPAPVKVASAPASKPKKRSS